MNYLFYFLSCASIITIGSDAQIHHAQISDSPAVAFERLIKSSPNINENKEQFFNTRAKNIGTLLQKDSSLATKKIDDLLPIVFTLYTNDAPLFKLLLPYNPHEISYFSSSYTPEHFTDSIIHQAAHTLNVEAVLELLNQDPRLANVIERGGHTTPLHQCLLASQELLSNLEIIKDENDFHRKQFVIAQAITNINPQLCLVKDGAGKTPLELAISLQNRNIIVEFLKKVNLNHQEFYHYHRYIRNVKFRFISEHIDVVSALWMHEKSGLINFS